MKNHSPAPWHHMESREQIIDADGDIVVYETNTSAADALLITAAPDLLAALQKVMALNAPFTGNPSHADLVEFWQDEKEQSRGAADDMLAALAAIAKATGAAL